jgi:hypothetical protein
MNLTTTGVWLIGIGSLVIFVGLIAGSEKPYEGMTFRGPFNTRAQRLPFAVEGAGACLVAVGSVLLAIDNPPSIWLLLVVPVAYLVVHTLTAWKLHQYWSKRLEKAQDGPKDTPLERQWLTCISTCASWRWCLAHPFNDEHWPKAVMDRAGLPTQREGQI